MTGHQAVGEEASFPSEQPHLTDLELPLCHGRDDDRVAVADGGRHAVAPGPQAHLHPKCQQDRQHVFHFHRLQEPLHLAS
jgi:hypothetical protein